MKLTELPTELKIARIRLGIKQGEMARGIGVNQAFLSRMEAGKTSLTALAMWEKAFNYLGIQLDIKMENNYVR